MQRKIAKQMRLHTCQQGVTEHLLNSVGFCFSFTLARHYIDYFAQNAVSLHFHRKIDESPLAKHFDFKDIPYKVCSSVPFSACCLAQINSHDLIKPPKAPLPFIVFESQFSQYCPFLGKQFVPEADDHDVL